MEKEMYYYDWWDHCLLRGTGIEKDIERAIDEHDWVKFKTYQLILNNMVCEGQDNEKWEYLPNYMTKVIDDDYTNGEQIELTEENFSLINCHSYECG